MDGEKYSSVTMMEGGWGCDRDRDTGGCCLLEVLEGCRCQVNILHCTLEGVEVVGDKCIRIYGSLFHGAIVRGKKLYL